MIIKNSKVEDNPEDELDKQWELQDQISENLQNERRQ